jgi:hypothetical protein
LKLIISSVEIGVDSIPADMRLVFSGNERNARGCVALSLRGLLAGFWR